MNPRRIAAAVGATAGAAIAAALLPAGTAAADTDTAPTAPTAPTADPAHYGVFGFGWNPDDTDDTAGLTAGIALFPAVVHHGTQNLVFSSGHLAPAIADTLHISWAQPADLSPAEFDMTTVEWLGMTSTTLVAQKDVVFDGAVITLGRAEAVEVEPVRNDADTKYQSSVEQTGTNEAESNATVKVNGQDENETVDHRPDVPVTIPDEHETPDPPGPIEVDTDGAVPIWGAGSYLSDFEFGNSGWGNAYLVIVDADTGAHSIHDWILTPFGDYNIDWSFSWLGSLADVTTWGL